MGIGIFIVDDQEDIRLLLRVLIENADTGLYVSGEAPDGRLALERIAEADPKVVILDQMMPGMSGLETARAIRERRPWQTMLLCSAHLDESIRSQAEAAGISACVAKTDLRTLPGRVRDAVASTG